MCAWLQRFSSISDTTTRVLKGGVANRWETRLNSVNDFLEGFRTTPTAAMLLKKAKIRLPYIKKVSATRDAVELRRLGGAGWL